MLASDTIAAVSTPFGEGAIALVRISGPGAIEITAPLFHGSKSLHDVPPRTALFGTLQQDGRTIDEVVATVYRAPASYTGENLVEIACHGGILVTRAVLAAFLKAGARLADPGEFTERAFLNGKMDLTQAEAVMDLIRAQTDLALRSATEQLQGKLGNKVAALREAIIGITAHLEAFIDFPDEDIDPDTGESLARQVDQVATDAERLLSTADQGRVLREGVRTVIFGEPNVGKSSLLNQLIGFDRAIVSERPGTTRDTIEEVINVLGIPLRIVDTAGIRESEDQIEREGIQRTLRGLGNADLGLRVVDASQPEDFALPAVACPMLTILNKTDLGVHPSWEKTDGIRISCATGKGIEDLRAKIFERVSQGCGSWDGGGVAINARHRDCLARATDHLRHAAEQLRAAEMPELVAVSLREAMDAVGEVSGRIDSDEILGRIFSTFCIGK